MTAALARRLTRPVLEVDDPECRELAQQLLREVRKIPT
jgi:hypothetical protein